MLELTSEDRLVGIIREKLEGLEGVTVPEFIGKQPNTYSDVDKNFSEYHEIYFTMPLEIKRSRLERILCKIPYTRKMARRRWSDLKRSMEALECVKKSLDSSPEIAELKGEIKGEHVYYKGNYVRIALTWLNEIQRVGLGGYTEEIRSYAESLNGNSQNKEHCVS